MQDTIAKRTKKKKGVTRKKHEPKDEKKNDDESPKENEDHGQTPNVTANEMDYKIAEEIKEPFEQETVKTF